MNVNVEMPTRKDVKNGLHQATDAVVDGVSNATQAVGEAVGSAVDSIIDVVDRYGSDALTIGYGICVGGLVGGPIGAVGGGIVGIGATRR